MRLKSLFVKPQDLGLALEALCWLAWAWVMLRFMPFFKVAQQLTPEVTGDSKSPVTLSRVRWAVTAVARRLPWRAVCFHQGIAAQRMLCRRGMPADLCYGVRTQTGKPDVTMDAHVWVVVADRIVVGGETAGSFKEITRFHPRVSKA